MASTFQAKMSILQAERICAPQVWSYQAKYMAVFMAVYMAAYMAVYMAVYMAAYMAVFMAVYMAVSMAVFMTKVSSSGKAQSFLFPIYYGFKKMNFYNMMDFHFQFYYIFWVSNHI